MIFCRNFFSKPSATDIKAVHVTEILQSYPAHYTYFIEYQDGHRSEDTRGARAQELLQYEKYLPKEFVQELKDEIEDTQTVVEYKHSI